MSASARVAAQAKINLFLRVLAREASGYHSIETVFQRIDLADDVHVRVASGRSLDCVGPAIPAEGLGPTERNLAFRAAVAYADAAGWPSGFAIEINKCIPVGGGLGGGSADAGAVLRALDALSPRPLGDSLVELATPLGADVPFMTLDRPLALAWGRGERLLPLAPLPKAVVLLLKPDFSVATADAYRWLSEGREHAPLARVLDPSLLRTWEGIAELAENDFDPVIAARHPEIAALRDGLIRMGATIALMSGSGSSVFGVFPNTALDARGGGLEAVVTGTSDRVRTVELEGR